MLLLIRKNVYLASDYFLCLIRKLKSYSGCIEKESWTTLTIVFLLYFFTCIVLYFFTYNSNKSKNVRGSLTSKRRILIVISHPDDECMFFGPTIVNLTKCKDKDVFLLCLSVGCYYKQDKFRKEELWRSCSIVGIPESNIFLQKISKLPDNPSVIWDENVINNLVVNYVESLHCDAIITFDKDGVSGHLNHKAIYFSLAHAKANNLFPNFCSIYCLDSVNKIRKFSFFFDILLSVCFSHDRVILSPSESYIIKNALRAHRTQYVWFRKLFIWTSRYSYINTYSNLCASDALFDINFREIYA